MNDLQQTYDQIIRPIEDRMIRSIWRVVRNPEDAEDAMQDALVTILKQWHRIRNHPNPQSLVLKICLDAACDATRRRLRQARLVELSQGTVEQAVVSQSPAETLLSRERYVEIVTAIHRLSHQQAISVLMRAIEGQPYEAIAAVLGCSEATARKHVARSRQRLRNWLARLDPSKAEIGDEQRR